MRNLESVAEAEVARADLARFVAVWCAWRTGEPSAAKKAVAKT